MSTGRPVFLVDMDGPLADFDVHFYARASEQGWTFDCGGPHEQRHRYFTDHMPNRQERVLARKMVESPGWFSDLPVTPGAQEGLHALAEVAEVWVCSKPLEANPTCRDEKAKWLAKHFGSHWEARLILAPDKSLVAGDILLDDAIRPHWLHRAVWTPVVYPTPWNGNDLFSVPRWGWGDDPHHLVDIALGGS